MARIVSAPELSALASLEATHHLRVEVQDPDGVYRDVSALLGVDWLDGCTINEDQDQPVATAVIQLARGHGSLSTAPLITGSAINRDSGASYAEYFRPGIGVRIYAAVTVGGAAPGGGDWKLMFRGTTDEVDVGEDQTVLTCRDPGGELVDRFIETEGNTYGSTPTPDASENVLQDIIDDHAPGHTVVTPVSPSFGILEYEQAQMPVMDALQAIVLELYGWDLRYRYSDGAGDFILLHRDPGRTKTAPDFTLTPSQYFAVPASKQSRQTVRNVVAVSYVDVADSTRKTATYTNAASVAKYGRRWMGIRLGSDSQINTPTEASALANAVGSDLSELPISHQVDAAFHWGIQLGDLIRLTSDSVHHDTNLDLAVFRITHTFDEQGARTLLDMRGKPAAASDTWRGMFPDEDAFEAIPVLTASADEDANVQATVLMPPAYQSIRILADLVDYPDLPTTEATTQIVDLPPGAVHILPEDIEAALGGPLETMDAANPNGYVSVVAYKGPGGTGERSPLLRDKTSIAAIPDGSIDALKIAIGAILDYHIGAGVITSAKLQTGLQAWSSTLAIDAIGDDQIAWHGPGGASSTSTLRLKDGTTYTINAVTSYVLTDSAIRYVYFDPSVSTTDLQVTTDYATLADDSVILIAWAKKGAFGNAVATVVPSPGAAGLPQIGYDALMAGSVGDNQIRAGSVIAGKIAAGAVVAGTIAAGAVTSASIAASQITAIHVAANAITSTAIQADAILAVHIATGVLAADNIEAGTISASVIIASNRLTASTVQIDGTLNIRNNTGVDRMRLWSSGGVDQVLGISNGLSLLAGAGNAVVDASSGRVVLGGASPVQITAGGSLVSGAYTASGNYLTVLVGGSTYRIPLYT